MIKVIIIADIIAYYNKMTEVFLGNVAILQPVMLLRNGNPSLISSWELYEIFRNGYGLDQLRERLLLKESYHIQKFTIYWVLRNFVEKLILTKLYALSFKWLLRDFSVMRMPLQEPSGVGVWSRHRKKLKLGVKICLTKCFLMTSSTWLIHLCIHSHTRNRF